MLIKIISKALVCHIYPLLNKFIDPFKEALFLKKGIVDNAIISQEVVQHIYQKKEKKSCLLFKIDLEKAYDRVD